jgi:hypothetical protein
MWTFLNRWDRPEPQSIQDLWLNCSYRISYRFFIHFHWGMWNAGFLWWFWCPWIPIYIFVFKVILFSIRIPWESLPRMPVDREDECGSVPLSLPPLSIWPSFSSIKYWKIWSTWSPEQRRGRRWMWRLVKNWWLRRKWAWLHRQQQKIVKKGRVLTKSRNWCRWLSKPVATAYVKSYIIVEGLQLLCELVFFEVFSIADLDQS